jgi:hypothetical protein
MADRTNVQLTPGAPCSTNRSTIRAVSVAIRTDGYMKLSGYGIDSVDGYCQTDAGSREGFQPHPDR